MPNAVFFNSYKLKKGASAPDFLAAVEKLNNEHISKQKGYISWQVFASEKEWADMLTFETMDDVKAFEKNAVANPNELALKFYSFINPMSCKSRYYTVEKSY